MPMSKNLAAYPAEFAAILNVVVNRARPWEVEFPADQKNHAIRLRALWYGWVKALLFNKDERVAASELVMVRLHEAGDKWKLEFCLRENEPAVDAFRKLGGSRVLEEAAGVTERTRAVEQAAKGGEFDPEGLYVGGEEEKS